LFKERIEVFVHKRISNSALLISAAIILNLFRLDLPILGRISFGSVFLNFGAIVYGPLYGAIIGLVADILSFIIVPSGVYLWQMTLIVALGGAMVSILYKYINLLKLSLSILFVLSYLYAVYGLIRNGAYDSILLYISLIAISAVVLVLFILKNKFKSFIVTYLNLFFINIVSGVFVTTLNSLVLMDFAFGSNKAFMIYLAPRLIRRLLTSIISVYFLTLIMEQYHRNIKRKAS
jgi:hypothetical protein